MPEAVRLMVDYAFTELKLHRIEAGVMPRNLGSIRVLEKAGFHREGIARSNVLINGKWEDHQVRRSSIRKTSGKGSARLDRRFRPASANRGDPSA